MIPADGTIPIEPLLWAMNEAESEDPGQRERYDKYRSCFRGPVDAEANAVGEVACPEPGTMHSPIRLDDDVRMDADAVEMEQTDAVAIVQPVLKPGCKDMPLEVDDYVRPTCRSPRLQAAAACRA